MAFPCLRLAYRRARRRRAQPAGGAERGERSGGRAVPRWAAGVPGDSADRSSGRWTRTRPRRLSRWHRFAPLDAWAREYAEQLADGLELKSLRSIGVTTLLAFAFVLGVLVFVHELGHFLAAKRVGIRVLKFQLGFNPTIAQLPPRRHRIRHRRAAARRLREDGRREPGRGTRPGSPTNSSRRRSGSGSRCSSWDR